MDQLLAVVQLLLVSVVLYFIYQHTEKERERIVRENRDFKEFSSQVIQSLSSSSRSLNDALVENQKEFMKQTRELSAKSFSEMNKLSASLIELQAEKTKEIRVFEEPKKIDSYDMVTSLSSLGVPNPIEREESPESELADMPRIPMVNGVRLQFEDEVGFSNPIDITPIGGVAPNMVAEA